MIEKLSYRMQVREYLLSQMILGQLVAGQSLSLAGLSRELDVSLTPIREALTQLEQAKIVKSIPNRGFIISDIDANEAKNIYEIIATLEALAVEKSDFSEDDIQQLIKKHRNFSVAKESAAKIQADMEFHSCLTGNYDNPFLRQIVSDLKIRSFFYEKSYMEDTEFTDISDDQHYEIIDLLKKGKSKQAARLTKENWLTNLKHIQKHFLHIHE